MTPDDLMRSTCYPSARHGRENAAFCFESPQTQSPTYRLCGNCPVPLRCDVGCHSAGVGRVRVARKLHRPHFLVPFNGKPHPRPAIRRQFLRIFR